MSEYTFVVEKKCPICGKMTRVSKTKARLITLSTDEDMCVHYRDFNPYYYKIWFCEHCGFAAEEKVFVGNMPAKHKEKIENFLSGRKMALEFVEERGKAEAVASFKLGIFYAEMLDASLNRRAGLYLMLAWVYRDAGERENEVEMLGRAAELYDKSLTTEPYPQNGMSDGLCMYLIGAIYYRMGEIEKSTQYLSRIIGDNIIRSNDPKLYDKTRNLWEDVRAAKKENNEEEGS